MTVNFTTINHEARIKLGLSWHEYGLADLIYHLANNQKSSFPNWCYAPKIKLGEMLGVSERAVHDLIIKLVEKGLIERNPETKFLRTTQLWFGTVIVKGEETSATMKKLQPEGEETSANGVKKLHTTYILDNNKTNIIDKSIRTSYGNPEVNQVLTLCKEKLSLPALDGTEAQNRMYAFNLLKKVKGVEGVGKLIDMAASDPWYSKNTTSIKDLYYNAIKIASRQRGGAIHVED